MDRELNHFNFNSKHCDKCELALKLVGLLAVSNLLKIY